MPKLGLDNIEEVLEQLQGNDENPTKGNQKCEHCEGSAICGKNASLHSDKTTV